MARSRYTVAVYRSDGQYAALEGLTRELQEHGPSFFENYQHAITRYAYPDSSLSAEMVDSIPDELARFYRRLADEREKDNQNAL